MVEVLMVTHSVDCDSSDDVGPIGYKCGCDDITDGERSAVVRVR